MKLKTLREFLSQYDDETEIYIGLLTVKFLTINYELSLSEAYPSGNIKIMLGSKLDIDAGMPSVEHV